MRIIDYGKKGENNDPIVNFVWKQLDRCIAQNPVEYNRYKEVIADEYFFVIMTSDIPYQDKVDMLEKHLEKWGPCGVNYVKPLTWNH